MKKVSLITGFLGAGKTTFLNHLIQQSDERILVIENEVGQSNVDGALVESGVEEVVELTAGCLCCSLSDGLLDALEMVSKKQDLFDRLVIETTGVADPSSIVQVFLADPIVERFFNLEQVICVADAGLIEDWLEETDEALRQLVMADVVLLNKKDTVSESYLRKVRERLSSVNPYSLIVSGERGKFPLDRVLQSRIKDSLSFEEKLEMVGKIDVKSSSGTVERKGSQHNINTFTLSIDDPFVLSEDFSIQLHRLMSLYRDKIYRVKGILYVQNYPNRVVLQSVRTSCLISDGTTWNLSDHKKSAIVFIGRGLNRDAFEVFFKRFTVNSVNESY